MGPELGASHAERTGPLPSCVVQGHGETWQLAALVRMPVFPEVRGAERPVPRTPWMPRQGKNKQPSGPCVSNSAKPVHSLGQQHSGGLRALRVGYLPNRSDGSQALGMWEVFQYFGLRQDAVSGLEFFQSG